MSATANITATKLGTGAVDNTEFNYLDGVTSAIQTQIGGKVTKTGDTMTGNLVMDNQSGIDLREPTGAGTNKVTLLAPDALGADYTLKLPVDDGNSGEVLSTNGSGVLSWVTAGGSVPAPGTIGNVLYVNGSTAWASGSPDTAGLVAKAGAQTITGDKTFSGFIQMNAQSVIRFADSDSSNWVGFRAPATVGADVTWTLPSTDSSGTQVLASNGSGALSWQKAYIQDGNSFSAPAVIGTNDNYSVSLEMNSVSHIEVRTDGVTKIHQKSIIGRNAIPDDTAEFDFKAGNLQYTTRNCATFNLWNLEDGGSYTLAVQGGTSATCAFNAYTDNGGNALTVKLPPDHGATTAGKHTMYTFLVLGSTVYVSWIPNY